MSSEQNTLEKCLQTINNTNLQLLGLLCKVKQNQIVTDMDLTAANNCIEVVEQQGKTIKSVTSNLNETITKLRREIAAKEKSIQSLRPYHDKVVELSIKLDATEQKLSQSEKSLAESKQIISALSSDCFSEIEMSDSVQKKDAENSVSNSNQPPATQDTQQCKADKSVKTNTENILNESQEFLESLDPDHVTEYIVPAKCRRDASCSDSDHTENIIPTKCKWDDSKELQSCKKAVNIATPSKHRAPPSASNTNKKTEK